MAKMNKAALDTFVQGVVAASKQAGVWNASTNNFIGLVDKIGKQVQLNGLYNDKLPELDGDELPLGKTIEEYFVDLTLPTSYSDIATEGAKDDQPALPDVEDCAYSYTLGRQKVKTTVPYDNIERAMVSDANVASAVTDITEKLQNSLDMTKYQMKKQLLGNAASKKVFAIMIDPRGIKLHEGYNATRAKENADGDFINYVKHFEETGFISKYTFIRVFEG